MKGEASSLISGLELTDANYISALKLLNDRYGSRKRQQRAHIRCLLELDCSTAREVVNFRQFVDSANKHLRALESLGMFSDEYKSFLCEILIDKVPNRIKIDWAELDDDDMNLEELLLLVETEAKKLELIKNSTGPITSDQKFKTKVSSHASNFVANKFHCHICKCSTHNTYSCSKLISATVDKRYEILREKRLCFNCLGNHLKSNCTSKLVCKVCGKTHHTILHFGDKFQNQDKSLKTESSCVNLSKTDDCILPVTAIPLVSGRSVIVSGALLDSGSQRSFIKSDILQSIDHSVRGTIPLQINGFGGSRHETCKIVEVLVRLEGQVMSLDLISTHSFPDLSFGDYKSISSTLSRLGLSPIQQCESVDLVIGSDYFYRFVTGESYKISVDAFGIETTFGWTIHGNLSLNNCNSFVSNVLSINEITDNLEVQRFWDNELAGILPISENCIESQSTVLSEFNSSISIDSSSRYVVKFPWKQGCLFTESFLRESKPRLFSTLRRLLKEGLLYEYDLIIKEYLSLDIIELASNDCESMCRYLPHHCVVKKDRSTTKVRIVFDGSSKLKNGKSLNDSLHEGPNMFPSIIAILARFRLYKFAICGDIEKAFLQIGLHSSDRDSVRFLWFEEPLKDSWPSKPEVSYRFKRVPFGVKPSPFLLNATIKHHLSIVENKYSETSVLLSNSLYVDDLILSCESLEMLHKVRNESIKIFESMKMKMHKWKCNVLDIAEPTFTSILGLMWDTSSDSFSVNFPVNSDVKTKRELTGLVCSLFDPLGFYSPFVIKLKILLQDVWQSKLDWDDRFPENICHEIQSIQNDIEKINAHKIPRHIGVFDSVNSTIEIHAFADASLRAYAACVYIVVDNVSSFLLISKTRLAPKKTITLPRLELMGCLIASRLLKTVLTDLNIKVSALHAWSDSKVALCWIQGNSKTFKQFVENRVSEIRSLFPIDIWQHISGKSNPADLATKPFPVKSWLDSHIWWGGPNFVEIRKYENSFSSEYSCLVNNEEIPKSSRIFQLSPFLDENGIMRSNSRLALSNVHYNSKFPIILDNNDRLTFLIIQFHHISSIHAGCQSLMTILRKRYWIIQCRRTINSVINKFNKCKRFKVKSCEQPFAPIVHDRVSMSGLRPFEATGLDFAGPFYLTKNRIKHYILLFTCLKVRAIHLELTISLDTQNFMKAFYRFKSRRGCPSLIRSDNAKTFKKASTTLALNFGIQWLFNTELAPWTGGVWERLVRSVKSSLRVVIKGYSNSSCDFSTILCQIEEIINKRPITYVTGNENDELLPLSPWNFLIIKHSDNVSDSLKNKSLVSHLIENNSIVKSFWRRWKLEYLPTLIPSKSSASKKVVKVDDVVLLNEGGKREYWPFAKVVEVKVGRDGVVRTIKLLCHGRLLTRPPKLIHVLESPEI